MLNRNYQFRFYRYKIPNTLFGIPIIWNGCYLEYSHTLLVSPSFTGFTHYLYTTDYPVYLEQSITSHSTIQRSTRWPVRWDIMLRGEGKAVWQTILGML